MNIYCVICSDLFSPSSEIYATQCGHIFHYSCLLNWLERSKTCPQCRHKATEKTIHRVYVNLSNNDNTIEDSSTLQLKVDNLQFQITCKDRDLKAFTEKYNNVKAQNAGLREELKEVEDKRRSDSSVIHALREQVGYFKAKCKDVKQLQDEIVKLKKNIRDMENVELALSGSREQANEILRNETNIESLALLAATLKKTLIDTERRKREIEHKHKQSQNDAVKYQKRAHLLEYDVSNLKTEVERLKKDLELEKQRWVNECYKKTETSEVENKDSTSKPIFESPQTFSVGVCNLSEVAKQIKVIQDSDSPYLPVKFSNVGLPVKFSTSSQKQPSNKFTIFKPPQQKIDNFKIPLQNSQVSYNGLGSSSKDEIFPTPKPIQTGIKRQRSLTVSTSKYRKLGPTKHSRTSSSK